MKARSFVGGVIATGILASGCGTFNNFENKEGDIVAGEPATVLQRWHNSRHTGKHGPYGYVLSLVTKDCDTNEDCVTRSHQVNIDTFLDFNNGDTIVWEGEPVGSTVLEHRYGRRYYFEHVYDLGLLVRQCVEPVAPNTEQQCVEDFVEVNFDTWYGAKPGDVITFSGDDGEVVSG